MDLHGDRVHSPAKCTVTSQVHLLFCQRPLAACYNAVKSNAKTELAINSHLYCTVLNALITVLTTRLTSCIDSIKCSHTGGLSGSSDHSSWQLQSVYVDMALTK